MKLRRVHQILGLSMALLWLVQIVTGVLLTFRQEIDNFLVGGTDAPLNVESMEHRMQSILAAGGAVDSVWVYNFTATRFDILYSNSAQHDRKMRVDGEGRVLRDGPGDSTFANGGFFSTLTDIHTTLLVGDSGKWIIGSSALLLLSNLIMGLKLAWPRRGHWKKSLALRVSRNPTANVYGLHRTLGLYIGLPMVVLVTAGILLCFDDALAERLHVVREPPVGSVSSTGADIGPARAMSLALARYPGSTLTAISMPAADRPWFKVRLHIRGEVPRMYGQTAIYLSANNGMVLREYPATHASAARLILDWLYPVHTAEAGGVVARAVLACLGLALLTMGLFGIRLWYLRSASRPAKTSTLSIPP